MSIAQYELLNQKQKSQTAKKRVAAYCRVSTDSADQANSFESQQRYFRGYIEHHPDWELYGIFADEGITGTNTKKRREFNRMISCAKSGAFDLIITKEISRFARNTLDSIYYTRDLKKHGVGVIFMNDGINTLDGDAELRLAIMASIAQEESRKTSERVKWGQKRRMEQGVAFGRDLLGYDVRGGKLYINEAGAQIVRLIFHKFVYEGKGTHVIARELQEAGIEPMRRVKHWSSTVILRVIRNEKYCGDLVQKKTYTPDFLSHEKKYNRGEEEFVILKDHHEPIIPRDVFDKANRILDERAQSPALKAKHGSRYPFSGKIRCGQCGAGYVARYRKRKDGGVTKLWRCFEAARYGRPHPDKAGNQIGCGSPSLHSEDAVHMMQLVCRKLAIDRNRIAENLMEIIGRVLRAEAAPAGPGIFMGPGMQTASGPYMAPGTTTGFGMPINPGTSIEPGIGIEPGINIDPCTRAKQIKSAVWELLRGVEYEDEFYKQLLDRMVVYDENHIDVYLNLLPLKWSFALDEAPNQAFNNTQNKTSGETLNKASEKARNEASVIA